jgi:hypothetical protein
VQPGSHGGGFFNDEEDLTAAIRGAASFAIRRGLV